MKNQVPKVELFDTSLRDGMQQPNLDISVPNAVLLLQRMAGFGLHYAEIGFAGAHQFVSDLTAALGPVAIVGPCRDRQSAGSRARLPASGSAWPAAD